MNYIIDPSWFYWIRVVDDLRVIFIILGIIGAGTSVFGLMTYWEGDYCYESDKWKRFKKIARGVIITTVVILLLIIFTPSKETLIEMHSGRLKASSRRLIISSRR